MDTKNVVRHGHVCKGCAAPSQHTAHQYAEVVAARNTYQRLYHQNTAQLAQARIEVHKLREQVLRLEKELKLHQEGAPMALLEEAVKMMAGLSEDRQQFDRVMGGVVRLPAKTLEFAAQGEALVSRATPLLSYAGVAQ
jgi:hypothetical protein